MEASPKLDVKPHICDACTKQWYGIAYTFKNTGLHLCWACMDSCRDSLIAQGFDYHSRDAGTSEVIEACKLWLAENKTDTPRRGNSRWGGEIKVSAWIAYYTQHPKGRKMLHEETPANSQ